MRSARRVPRGGRAAAAQATRNQPSPPFPLRLVPRRERLQIRHPGKPGPGVEETASGVTTTSSTRTMRETHDQSPPADPRALDALACIPKARRHRRVVAERKPRSDDLAVRLLLVVHLDLPRPVVGDDDEHRRPWRDRGVDFHRVETERPSPVTTTTADRGTRSRGYAKAVPTPMQPSGPGSSQVATAKPTPGETEDIPPSPRHRVVSDRSCRQASMAIGCMRPSRPQGASRIAARSFAPAPRAALARRVPTRDRSPARGRRRLRRSPPARQRSSRTARLRRDDCRAILTRRQRCARSEPPRRPPATIGELEVQAAAGR